MSSRHLPLNLLPILSSSSQSHHQTCLSPPLFLLSSPLPPLLLSLPSLPSLPSLSYSFILPSLSYSFFILPSLSYSFFILPLPLLLLPHPPRSPYHKPELTAEDGPIGLICAPTRELCQQIYHEARKFGKVYGLRSCAVYGGVSKWEQVKALKDGAEILVATPVSSHCMLLVVTERHIIGFWC